MADKRITQIATTYDRDDLALATDYLIVDRSGGSSARILAEEVVHGVLENTADPIVIASDVNVDSGTLFVDVSTNRVGVGTTSPVADFEIRSASTATLVLNGGGVVGGAGVRSDLSGTSGSTLGLWTKADGGASAERIHITASGNVGIGTTTPGFKLHVASTSFLLMELERTGATAAGSIEISRGTNIYSSGLSAGSIYSDTNLAVATDGQLFLVSGGSERVRINSSGNVGIGTTSPSVKLQVAGAIAITDGMTAPSTVSGYAVLYVDSSGGDLKIKFGDGTVKTIVTDS